jgi:hypothetical protein
LAIAVQIDTTLQRLETSGIIGLVVEQHQINRTVVMWHNATQNPFSLRLLQNSRNLPRDLCDSRTTRRVLCLGAPLSSQNGADDDVTRDFCRISGTLSPP